MPKNMKVEFEVQFIPLPLENVGAWGLATQAWWRRIDRYSNLSLDEVKEMANQKAASSHTQPHLHRGQSRGDREESL